MMWGIVNALAMATALTAIFTFRFRVRRVWIGVAYFALFAAAEGIAHALILPEGAIPKEAAFVLFGIGGLFVVANVLVRKLEARNAEHPDAP